MKYCFDLDDVISNTYAELMKSSMRYHIKVLKYAYVYREIQEAKGDYTYFYKTLNWKMDELDDFFHTEYPAFLDRCVPNRNAINLINELYQQNNEIHILSAREEREKCVVYKKTKEWLEKFGVKYDKVSINVSTKSVYLNENGIDIFVDDLWDNCVEAKKNSSSVVCHVRCEYNMRTNYDYSYGIIEIKDWNKFRDILKSLC